MTLRHSALSTEADPDTSGRDCRAVQIILAIGPRSSRSSPSVSGSPGFCALYMEILIGQTWSSMYLSWSTRMCPS
eukprot:9259921-Pyramimonas_sp.AAC.1